MKHCEICGTNVVSPCMRITDLLRCSHVSVGEAESMIEFVPAWPSAPHVFEPEEDLPSKEDILSKFEEEPSDTLMWALGMEKKPPRSSKQ